MTILKSTEPDIITKAVEVLKAGGILIYPTETCYGVGVDATNTEAVTKVLDYKKRPEGKAISIGCADEEMATRYVNINLTAKNIYKNFLPGPVTVISKSRNMTDPRLASEKGSLGIRIPAYPLLLDIINAFGKPITTTSANSAGKKTPYTVQDILDNISTKQRNLISLIIDAGELPKNPPSTVLDTTTDDLKTYRAGGVLDLFLTRTLKSETFSSLTVTDTLTYAKSITEGNYEPAKTLVFFLKGDLGAGKTHFAKGIAQALNILRTIKSPTYNYVDEYTFATGKFLHVDAWRLESADDLNLLQPQHWFNTGNVVAIEWPDIFVQLCSEDLLGLLKNDSNIKLILVDISGQDERVLKVSSGSL